MDVTVDLKNYFTNQVYLNEYYQKEIINRNDLPEYFSVDGFNLLYAKKSFALFTETKFDTQYITQKTQIFEKDTIVCEAQTIEVPQGKYKIISFFGGCLWDYFCEYLTINYSDGSNEKRQLFFYNFYDWEAMNYVLTIPNICTDNNCSYIMFHTYDKDDKPVIGYEFGIILETNKEITSITLPDNENMCIFAMTLKI